MEWLKSILNEPGTNTGSSQRVSLLLIICFVLGWMTYLIVKTGALPAVPASFETLIEYLCGFVVVGIGAGKFFAKKGADNAGQDQSQPAVNP